MKYVKLLLLGFLFCFCSAEVAAKQEVREPVRVSAKWSNPQLEEAVSKVENSSNRPSKIKVLKAEVKTSDGVQRQEENQGLHFSLQMLLLLIIIYFGVKFGGVALGLLGGLGVFLLVILFGIVPGKAPIDVMLIILAVVTTSSTLEATGALNAMVNFTEKLLRKNPKNIVFLSPIATFILTVLVGTGHASYALYPVIYDVAYKQKIRPERPMAISAVASQMGITASPVAAAAATVLTVATANGVHITLLDILKVTMPACFIGMLIAAVWSLKRGKDLFKDPKFLARYNDPKTRAYMQGDMDTDNKKLSISKNAIIALIVFVLGILTIILFSIKPDLLPKSKEGKMIPSTQVIQFVMLAAGAIIVFLTRIKSKDISGTRVFNAGMVAAVMIFGIAWMSESVINHNEAYIISLIKDTVKAYPWTFAIAMFTVSVFLKSQAVVLGVMLPLGFALDLPVETLIGSMPSCYAYFFFCFYPTDLAAINFDRSGTTHVGSYILNHSFMIPGLIGVGSATVIGNLITHYLMTF